MLHNLSFFKFVQTTDQTVTGPTTEIHKKTLRTIYLRILEANHIIGVPQGTYHKNGFYTR